MATQLVPPIDRAIVERVVREVVVARLTQRAMVGAGGTAIALKPPTLAVHSSARHIHLCRHDLEKLFGPGAELTPDRELYQPGNFAAKETVTLIGPRSRLISNLRILGPLRERTQVELAFTDAISLGIDVPVRLSGDISGTPGAVIMGPAGVVELGEGVIRAALHVHMSPEEATYLGAKHKDVVTLRVTGEASCVAFERVHVRVEATSRLNVHMDTDEANACGLHLARRIELVGANGQRAFAVAGRG
jgi:putative phosphotransacetylase